MGKKGDAKVIPMHQEVEPVTVDNIASTMKAVQERTNMRTEAFAALTELQKAAHEIEIDVMPSLLTKTIGTIEKLIDHEERAYREAERLSEVAIRYENREVIKGATDSLITIVKKAIDSDSKPRKILKKLGKRYAAWEKGALS